MIKRIHGIVSTTPVCTPYGMLPADTLSRGSEIVVWNGEVFTVAEIRSMDRRLCCRVNEIHTAGGRYIRMARHTLVVANGSAMAACELQKGDIVGVTDGKDALVDAVAENLKLNFCQQVIYFHCGDGLFLVAGRPGNKGLLVSTAYFEKGNDQ